MKTIEWGFLIVNYLFLGGLSAGLFFVSALATFLYRIDEPSPYTRIARLGALLAPWPVMIGCLLLIFDLGRWYHFYKLFLHVRLVSPMSIGSWLLVLFNLVALLNCYAWLTEKQRSELFAKLPGAPRFLKIRAAHPVDRAENRQQLCHQVLYSRRAATAPPPTTRRCRFRLPR